MDSEDLAGKLLDGYEAAFPELGRLWHGGRDDPVAEARG